jgi:hypothetical protein
MRMAEIVLLVLLFCSGCSAKWHLNRYQIKGGVCGKIDTIRVTKFDTITNKYYTMDSLVIVNDRIVPLTSTEIRYRYKIERDTLVRLKERIIKEKTKQIKYENKQPWAWVALGVIILILLYVIKSWFHR